MAAFIQKLFKNRKPQPVQEKKPAPQTLERQDRQDDLKSEQDKLLAGQPSPTQLEELALNGVTVDIRQQAATAITERESLQRTQKAAKGKDKRVYQIVRQKLQEIKQAEEQQQQTEERIRTLIRQAEEQASSEDTNLYEARFEALLLQWKPLETQAGADQVSAFLAASHSCRERIAGFAAAAEEERRHEEQASQRTSTLELLEATLDELKQQPAGSLPSLSALDALQKTQENRWMEATRDTQVAKSQQKQYENAMQALKSFLAAVRRYSNSRESIATLVEASQETDLTANQRSQAQALLEELAWPAGYSGPDHLGALATLAQKPSPAASKPVTDDSEPKVQTKALGATLDHLEQALEARQLKESRQHFKKAQQLQKSLDKRHARPHQARLQLLGNQLRELNDWQGFATTPKQVDLCERMEYLAEQHMEPEAKAGHIKELQNEWRELGGSSDRTLWERFKKASDAAYEPCKAYFSAKSDLKQGNLAKRATICDELQTYLDSADLSDADWKAVERILRTAREEWKEAWPVDFRDNRSIQKRFDSLLKRLETPLNKEREKNEQLKHAIVERAQALIELEPLSEAMNQAKTLQSEWRSIGITRHREDRKLWRAFRQACDTIFERRDAERSAQQQETEAANQRLQDTLARTGEITETTSNTAEVLAEALQQLDELGSQPLSRAMAEQLTRERKRLQALKAQQALAARIENWHQHIDACQGDKEDLTVPNTWSQRATVLKELSARELVIRAEILSEVASPEQDQALRMEIQVQRLSDGMTGNNTQSSAADQLEALVAHWCLGLNNDERSPEMAERLKQALNASIS